MYNRIDWVSLIEAEMRLEMVLDTWLLHSFRSSTHQSPGVSAMR